MPHQPTTPPHQGSCVLLPNISLSLFPWKWTPLKHFGMTLQRNIMNQGDSGDFFSPFRRGQREAQFSSNHPLRNRLVWVIMTNPTRRNRDKAANYSNIMVKHFNMPKVWQKSCFLLRRLHAFECEIRLIIESCYYILSYITVPKIWPCGQLQSFHHQHECCYIHFMMMGSSLIFTL